VVGVATGPLPLRRRNAIAPLVPRLPGVGTRGGCVEWRVVATESLEEGYLEVVRHDNIARQLCFLSIREIPHDPSEAVRRDREHIVQGDHTVMVQPIIRSDPDLAGQALGSVGQVARPDK
jgi:hypothetical protein